MPLLLTMLFFWPFALSSQHNPMAQNFFTDVWTYDEYKQMNLKTVDVQTEFEAQVTRAAPPRLTRKLTSPISIAMIFPGLQASDYWRRTRQAFEARLKQANVPYYIDAHFTQADALRQQENYIRQAMKKSPRYLIFTLNVMRHMRLTEQIIGRGESKLIIQNMTTPMKAWEGTQPFLYVGFDHEIGSKILADEFLKRICTQGHYALGDKRDARRAVKAINRSSVSLLKVALCQHQFQGG